MSSSSAAARVPVRPVTRPLVRERPQPPRLRVVAPSTHRSATGLALLCVALLGGGLLVLLLLNISIGKGAYALTKLQSQQRQLLENQQSLAEQVEAQSAPAQLAAAARKLGMVASPSSVFLQPNGKVEGEPSVAQAPPKPKPKKADSATGVATTDKTTNGTTNTTNGTTKTTTGTAKTTNGTATGTATAKKAPAARQP
jgi:hypothetical protein